MLDRMKPAPRAIVAVLLLVASTLGTAGPSRAAESLDWCAPVIVRPDQRWWSTSPCEPWWKPDTIAQRADFVFDGFFTPVQPVLTPDTYSCWGSTTVERSRAYHDDLRARAAAHGRTLRFVYFARFDLVLRAFAALPGFEADFGVEASVPLSESAAFFSRDTSEPCVCGCAWSDEPGPSPAPAGTRLRDLIDARGGAGASDMRVHQGVRPATGGTADGIPRRFFGHSIVADQRNAAYRAWMIEEVKQIQLAGGYDAVDLNQKFHLYLPTNPPQWWATSHTPDVATYLTDDMGRWSSQPIAYGYPEYVEGWALLADDLISAGVPYTVTVSPMFWRPGFTGFDDPASALVDEMATVRSVARRAAWLFLDKGAGGNDGDVATATADVVANGSATVVPIHSGCGYGPVDSPVNPLPALSGQVAVTPDAGAQLQYRGRAITVRPFGTATGPWSADFWCHCPSPPCGTPDAQVVGETASSWSVPADTCDVRWGAATGTWRPRVQIIRASSTVQGTDTVTICQPACSNGKDDDGDGAADFPADPGCGSATDRYENLQCDNGKDDDGDGLVDWPDDPGCVVASQSFETPPSSCGMLGLEAVAALAAIAVRRRAVARRRRPGC